MHDLDPLNLRVQPEHARLAPAPADRAIPQLSSRLEEMNSGRPVMSGA
jgi:hypothetical protein